MRGSRDGNEYATLVGDAPNHSSYQSIVEERDEPPDYPSVINVLPEVNSRNRWNHIEDLDSFFRRVYLYHQKHGFWCMVTQEFLELVQFIFVIVFSVFLLECVDYSVLFRDKTAPGHNATDKISLTDAFLPTDQCMANVNGFIVIVLIVASTFWVLFLVKFICNVVFYWEISRFYVSALKISSSELDNMTWHEVQRRLREVQTDLHMCVHKALLTELDVYNRILRFENYFIAMVNKNLLPLKFSVPFMGEVVFLSRGFKYNLELLLFRATGAPFENNWHLKTEFKSSARRVELAQALSKRIMWFAVGNMVLSPLIFLWQIMYSVFHYTELVKKDPSFLGVRRWSAYGRVYLRHFNELDHELTARLNRGYAPASRYMSSFTTPLLSVIAKKAVFFFGAPLAVLIILTVIDEDVLTAEYALTIMTVFGGVVAICRSLVPDENMVWCPEMLMNNVLAQVHYLPDQWVGKAHTSSVREQFAQFFQLKLVYVLEELLSPLVTPFMLFFVIRPQAQDIVDFLRNFTVDVVGVGDVCSFAQMDVKRHGSPTWRVGDDGDEGGDGSGGFGDGANEDSGKRATSKPFPPPVQAENGKTELSLVHFALTNPDWRPPKGAATFLHVLQRQAQREMASMYHNADLGATSIFAQSLNTVSQMPYANPLMSTPLGPGPAFYRTMGPSSLFRTRQGPLRGAVSQIEGSLELEQNDAGVLSSIHEQGYEDSLMGVSTGVPFFGSGSGRNVSSRTERSRVDQAASTRSPVLEESESMVASAAMSAVAPSAMVDRVVEFNVANMSLSAVYLHEMHRRRVFGRRGSMRTPVAPTIPEDELESSGGAGREMTEFAGPKGGSVYFRSDRGDGR